MQERIKYIDSAKGLCMLLIVASHVGVPDPWPGAYAVRVILFFVLSGYFFSARLVPIDFAKKKALSLFVPFLIWWVISYALFYIGDAFVPDFKSMTLANGILDCFTQKEYFNGPLWFLLALLFVQLFCYPVERYIKSDIVKLCTYSVIGLIGFGLSVKKIDLPLDVDVALSATPFFAMGMLLRRYSILERFKTVKESLFTILVSQLMYVLLPIVVCISVNDFGNNSFPEIYGIGAALTFSYILLTKLIDMYLPRLSSALAFVGKHSMWIMCSHHLIYRPIKIATNHIPNPTVGFVTLFVLTMLVCLLLAPLVERYIPITIGKVKR